MATNLPPFLPELDPPPPPARSNAKRTLILWVVLIMMFLAIWQFLSPDPSKAHPAPTAAPCESSSSWAASALPVLVTLAVVAFFIWFMRVYTLSQRWIVEQEPARRAAAEGRFGDAAQYYLELAERNKKKANHALSMRGHAAHHLMLAGRFDEALALFQSIERTRTVLMSSGERITAATHVGLIYALKGELEAAERWTSESRARLQRTFEERFGHGSMVCLADAIIAIRRGDSAKARSLLEASWLEMQATLTVQAMRGHEVVRAFAEAERGPRDSNLLAECFVRIRPVQPGELVFLGVAWPEIRAFLAANGVGTA